MFISHCELYYSLKAYQKLLLILKWFNLLNYCIISHLIINNIHTYIFLLICCLIWTFYFCFYNFFFFKSVQMFNRNFKWYFEQICYILFKIFFIYVYQNLNEFLTVYFFVINNNYNFLLKNGFLLRKIITKFSIFYSQELYFWFYICRYL